VPIYTSIQWDYYTAVRHPEWLVLDEKGNPTGTPALEAGFSRNLCVNTPYRQFLDAHVQEIFEAVPVDGLFFDHRLAPRVHVPLLSGVDAQGRFGSGRRRPPQGIRTSADQRLQAVHDGLRPQARQGCSIFFNAGHIGPRHRAVAQAYTHWNLNLCPAGLGYLDFPLKQRYVRTLGMEALGMTGKFHTSWGDFHSLKNPAALEYECFLMLALGGQDALWATSFILRGSWTRRPTI